MGGGLRALRTLRVICSTNHHYHWVFRFDFVTAWPTSRNLRAITDWPLSLVVLGVGGGLGGILVVDGDPLNDIVVPCRQSCISLSLSVFPPSPTPSIVSSYNRTFPDTLPWIGGIFCGNFDRLTFHRSALGPDILPDPPKLYGIIPPLPPLPFSGVITASGSCSSQIPVKVAARRGYRGYKTRYQY